MATEVSIAKHKNFVKKSFQESFTKITKDKDFVNLYSAISAFSKDKFHFDMIKPCYAKECEKIFSSAFTRGGGSYEIIKNFNEKDFYPISKFWVKNAIENGLSIVLLDSNNKVAFVTMSEAIGFEENTPMHITNQLTENGKLRQKLRIAFEQNDPFWTKLIKLSKENKLSYGQALAGAAGTRVDLQGHPTLSTLGFLITALIFTDLAQHGVLKYMVGDATHWKIAAYMRFLTQQFKTKFGNESAYQTSEFDAKIWVKNHYPSNYKQLFNTQDSIDRKMSMFVTDYTFGKKMGYTWKHALKDYASDVKLNSQIYEKYKSKSKL